MTRFERKRLALGLTQRALGKLLGVGHPTVCRWERGDATPSPEYFPKLATLFGMTPEEVTHLFDKKPQASSAA